MKILWLQLLHCDTTGFLCLLLSKTEYIWIVVCMSERTGCLNMSNWILRDYDEYFLVHMIGQLVDNEIKSCGPNSLQ